MVEPPRRRVLVVEDDQDQFDALAVALDASGYLVRHAVDGSAALAILREFGPHLVVTDLMMSGMSGEDFIGAIRAIEGPRTRVLVVSGRDRLAVRCAQIGADAWLAKPFDLDAFLEAVRIHSA